MSQTPQHKDYDALLKQSFLSLKKVQSRLDALERARKEPIAIIGIGCRFPAGANDSEAFWQLVRDEVDTVSEIPADRWDAHAMYDPDSATPGKINTRWASFLQQIDLFDAGFFGISHREAVAMDPQQRLLLEVAWEALEDAGQPREQIAGSQTGVFIGVCNNDYTHLALAEFERIDAYASTGCAHSIVPNRLSYVFDLKGPSVAVDTACSSSLVAIHLACQALRSGECNMALSGGVNLVLTPESTISFSKFGMLAGDGRCKAFDASADGFVRGDGCGVLVLKRLSDALAAGDPILALIRGSAVNQDGRSAGLTAPSGPAQQTAIRQALDNAGLKPGQISYVEAHGTGTSLGDPIEVEALSEVYGQPQPDGQPCVVGSVKANIGHTEATAAVAGVIKTVLALRHQLIPRQLHLNTLNPNIVVDGTRITFATAPLAWPAGAEPRRAGVNSFSFGGTNAHLILEEAPAQAEPETTNAPRAQVLPLSAQTPEGLAALATAVRDQLNSDGPLSPDQLRDLSYSASVRRTHHEFRLAVASTSSAELAEHLDAFLTSSARPGLSFGRRRDNQRHKIAFVCPGHGSQWFGMARGLLEQEPVFRAAIERCEQALQPYVDWSLTEQLQADDAHSRLDDVAVIQPALWAIEIALAAVWRAWGIEPDAVVGHSMGEIAAAQIAGALTLDDAARIIACRSRLLRRASGHGAMAMVDLSFEQARAALAGYEDRLVIGLSNSPRSTVLSGDPQALDEVIATLEQRQVFCRRVKSDIAFHSPQMDPLCRELHAGVDGIAPQPATLPLYSTVDGQQRDGRSFDADYWVRNLRQPVLFAATVQQLLDDGITIFVELSPHPILLPAIEQGLRHRGQDGTVLPSLRREQDERTVLLGSLGALYSLGYPVDWTRLHAERGRVVALPHYPWQRERFWVAPPSSGAAHKPYLSAAPSRAGHPLLGQQLTSSTQPGVCFWELAFNLQAAPYLKDHCVRGAVVVPATAYLESITAATHATFGPGAHTVEEVAFKQVLIVREDEVRTVQLVISADSSEHAAFQVASAPIVDGRVQDAWTLHTTGTIRIAADATHTTPTHTTLAEIQARCQETLSGDEFYAAMEEVGFAYGPTFQGATQLWFAADEALAELRLATSVAAEAGRYYAHPALLDICFHSIATTKLKGNLRLAGDTFLPVGLDRLSVVGDSSTACWSHAQLRAQDADQPDRIEGDVFLLDRAGQVVVAAEGLQMQRLNREIERDTATVDEWLYTIGWEARPLATSATTRATQGSWLLFSADDSVGDALAEQLRAHGQRCVTVTPGDDYAQLTSDRYRLSPTDPDGFGKLLRDALRADQPPCLGIVYLWGAEPANATAAPTLATLTAAQDRGCTGVLHLVQALAHAALRTEPRLWLVTRGTQAVDERSITLAHAPLWGLGRVIGHEHPGLRCTAIDLPLQDDAASALFDECWSDDNEDQVVLRTSGRYVARLLRYTADAERGSTDRRYAELPAFSAASASDARGDRLVLDPLTRRTPGPHEIEIQVHAAGVQTDCQGEHVLLATGGCSGVIVATGADVRGLAVGDEVIAVGGDELGSFRTLDARLIVRRPEQLTVTQAAAISLRTLTVWYALHDAGSLRPGERMLIHATTRETVRAAVQLAQQRGVEALAVAATPEQRAWLAELGVATVLDSQSPTLAADVLLATSGHGVDIVLNAYPGERGLHSLGCLAPYGRFIDIGPSPIEFQPRHANASYTAVDVNEMAHQRPARFGALLAAVVEAVVEGTLTLPPVAVLPLNEASESLAVLGTSHSATPTVLHFQATSTDESAAAHGFRVDATYLISGGLGGLGLTVAQWMVAEGARHLVLLSRRGLRSSTTGDSAAEIAVAAMRAAGAEIVTAAADVASAAQLAEVLARIDGQLPPLRGIIHAAGVLDDGILLQLNRERFRTTLASKLDGAWNLHTLTLDQPLDFFVNFSSAAAMLGSPGQGNYAAANAFLDALAFYRQAQGRPALSVNWGPWAEVGLAAQVKESGQLSIGGIAAIQPDQGVALLGRLMRQSAPQVGVMPLNLRQWRQFYPKAAKAPLLSHLAEEQDRASANRKQGSGVRDALLAVETGLRRSILETHLHEQIIQVVRIAPSRLDAFTPLGSLGLDSLMALELRNRLEDSLDLTLPVTLIWNYQTITDLATHLAEEMTIPIDVLAEPIDEPATALFSDEEADALADALLALDELSLDELQQLTDDHTSGVLIHE